MICQNNIVGKIIRTRDRPKRTHDRPKWIPSLSGLFGQDFFNSLDLVDCGGFLWVGILEI